MFRCFIRCRRGATAIEYAFIASLIALGCVAAMALLGNNVNNHYTNISTEVQSAMP